MTLTPSPVRVGFMPLVDSAPLVMASVLGFDRRHGVQLLLSRESSWAGLRDKLLGGALDLAQALYGMVFGVQLGIGGPRESMAVLMTLNRNGQGISLSRRLTGQGVADLNTLAARLRAAPRTHVFAQTFPTGTHAMWLYYALASAGVHPMRDIRSVVLPPAQMVEAMRSGQVDGVSVGAPWNRIGLLEDVSVPLLSSSAIWPEHPDKVLAGRAAWADAQPDTAVAVVRAVLEASRWLEASEANRLAAAEILAGDAWLAARRDAIAGSLLGEGEPLPMRFHADGAVNYPWLSDGIWFMTQHKRWGLLADHPEYEAIARRVQRVALYRDAAAGVGVPLPEGELRSSRLIDGLTWDGRDPRAYADSFAIRQPQSIEAA
ncbi:CmpA/NrtA family ABC transporter substrate-binding protein [Rubrivivax albus]|uniref:Nitrate ABC transporter substrate-binding protein n=1 Tax=Rubrivivax albus TaxID=2499835 RepID=A0A3S2UM61_9BURK|nr:CmpA/NrtA family ABC transporter substrate-binding protein [Rubrivivax albus]RVT48879.1 nitrate ABC transporter substrate-binding protein [Rubrivivax albus]